MLKLLGDAINKKANYCNIVADMKADASLKAGSTVITLGYHITNDGRRSYLFN